MYILNNEIRVGDIILVRGAAKHSKIIAQITNGHFSHAMIALENRVFLEAITGTGVQRTSSLRVCFQDKSNVAVLRCNFPNDDVEKQVLKYIAKNSATYQGRKYSFSGAIQSTNDVNKMQNLDGYFCSHLVAAMYEDAGFPLFDKPAHKITPNCLLESSLLSDITEAIVSPLSERGIKRREQGDVQFDCIDAGGSTMSQDAKNHRKFINDVAKYFRRYKLNAPDNVSQIGVILLTKLDRADARQLDYLISKAYKKSGINKYISNNVSTPNFKNKIVAAFSEIKNYGNDYALQLYSDYFAHTIMVMAKQYPSVKTQKTFDDCSKASNFKFFALQAEYYNLIVESSNAIISDAQIVLNTLDESFPQYKDEFTLIKSANAELYIEKQNDPEIRSALIEKLTKWM